MKLNHKLKAVIRHEFLTIVKQPSFWISLIAVPLITGVVLLIGMLTDNSKDTVKKDGNFSIVVIDKSNLIVPDIAKANRVTVASPDKEAELKAAVKAGDVDGLVVYPSNLKESGSYQLFADNTDRDNGAVISQLGKTVLQESVLLPLNSKSLADLARTGGVGKLETFVDGKQPRQFIEYVVPGAFLVLFYMVLVFSVGYALTSVSEEKENRSIEMVLSYVKPRTLILGKLLAIILVTMAQILIILAMAGAGLLIARAMGNDLSLPFDLTTLTFVPFEVFIGVSFLVVGFIFYVALMAMIGAIFPSSKEAGSFSTVFFILPAVPFWGFDAITTQANSVFTQILTYFPLTSPTTVLLRNAAGNLDIMSGLLSLAILALTTVATIALAARAFKLGTLEFSERVKFTTLFKRQS
jgi:ABC-2 type transport system permease protein